MREGKHAGQDRRGARVAPGVTLASCRLPLLLTAVVVIAVLGAKPAFAMGAGFYFLALLFAGLAFLLIGELVDPKGGPRNAKEDR